MRYLTGLLFLLLFCGCKGPVAETHTTPQSTPSPVLPSKEPENDKTPVREIPYEGNRNLSPRSSSIEWPEGELKLTAQDMVELSHWIGGVAGTDTTSVAVYGDGRVVVRSGREGGPGGKDSEAQGKLSPEDTRAVFTRLRDSGLLEQEEQPSGTTGSDLVVEFKGQTDRVRVSFRSPQAEEVLGNARSAVEPR